MTRTPRITSEEWALVRKALRAQEDPSYSWDFPVFKVREDAPAITPEMVEAAQGDL